MGLSSKKTKTTEKSTSTTTPTAPTWVSDSVQNMQGRINGLLNTDASTLVPGASKLQSRAYGAAAGLLGGGGGNGLFGPMMSKTEAAAAANGGGGAAWKSGNGEAQDVVRSALAAAPGAAGKFTDVDLDAYMNPWLDDVVDTTLTGFDEQSGMNRAQLAANQARGQKFSGSGSAIERALFERGNIQDRSKTEADLRSGGFDRAAALAMQDLDRTTQNDQFNTSARYQGAGLLGDLADRGATNQRADIGLLSDLGDKEREIEREKLGAEPQLLQLISALNGGQNYNLFTGQTTDGSSEGTSVTSDPMGAITGILGGVGGLMKGAGAMGLTFSDKRLKEDIETEGKDGSGRRVVSYRYKGEPKDVRRVGHIAQEVKKSDPHAVKKVGKYLAIDYGLLGDVA